MVAPVPAASVRWTVSWPAQFKLIVLLVVPPLNASSCNSPRGDMNVKLALVGPAPLKPMLSVVNPANGPDRYQLFVPQSITLDGYWPLSGRLGFVRSSNVR